MRLFEFDSEDDLDAGYYTPSDDQFNILTIKNTRSPHLTLRHLNRLKKMRAAKELENLIRADTLELMYSVPDESAGGPPGGL
jgi:hypothetical protein